MNNINFLFLLLFITTCSCIEFSYICCYDLSNTNNPSTYPFWIKDRKMLHYLLNLYQDSLCFTPKTMLEGYYISNNCSLMVVYEMNSYESYYKNDTSVVDVFYIEQSKKYGELFNNMIESVDLRLIECSSICDTQHLGFILVIVATSIFIFIIVFICVVLFWGIRKSNIL